MLAPHALHDGSTQSGPLSSTAKCQWQPAAQGGRERIMATVELAEGATLNDIHRLIDIIMLFKIQFREGAGEVCC